MLGRRSILAFGAGVAGCGGGPTAGTIAGHQLRPGKCEYEHQSSYVWRGVDVSAGMAIEVQKEPMPNGLSFAGTYWSAHVGILTLTQTDTRLKGAYRGCTECSSCAGALEGTIDGTLAELNWIEREAEGDGYLIIKQVSPGVVRLFGERWYRGKGKRHDGQTWTAARL